MTLEKAIELLSGCEYEGLKDQTFGDVERGWWKGKVQVAEGYFRGDESRVIFPTEDKVFTGAEARRLKDCGVPMRFGLRAATCGPTWPE